MSKLSLDRSTYLGAGVALTGVMAGVWLDGGSVRQLLQPTAALIVGAGTAGAVMLQFPLSVLTQAAGQLKTALLEPGRDARENLDDLVRYCSLARRQGMLSLDRVLPEIADEFLRKALTLCVDNFAISDMRRILERDLQLREEQEEDIVRVFETAGGFSPTLGIMGAVLGLVQVMQHMDNMGEVGKGIAVSFVSTLYGIGLANLLFLPLAGKLRIRFRERQTERTTALEAILLIAQGINPVALRHHLEFAGASPVWEAPPAAQELASR